MIDAHLDEFIESIWPIAAAEFVVRGVALSPGGRMTSTLQVGYDLLVERAFYDAYDCHGDLSLDRETFKDHVSAVVEKHLGCAPPVDAALSFIKRLHTNDLYLAAACAQRNDLAWKRFSEVYGKRVTDFATSVCPNWNAARELAADVLSDLFLADRSGRPRIASYEGRSTLTAWLRVVVSNHAINERSCKFNSSVDLDALPEAAYVRGPENIDAVVRAGRYEQVVTSALKSACETLTDPERLVLLLRYDEELQVSRVARLLGVHACTVTRQLERIQQKLRDDVVSTLASKYLLSQAQIEECLVDLMENPSHSILSIIKEQ